ncbi:MAG TPA: luciferase family protein [Thermoleophilaceae bacterium]
MGAISSRADRIAEEVTSWPGIEAGHGSRGEFGFKLGRREIGHLHGDRAAHFMFGRQLGLKLKAEGRVVDHPVFPGKAGPGARRIESDDDVGEVIELMRLNYDRLRARPPGTREPDDGAPPAADPLQHGQSAG